MKIQCQSCQAKYTIADEKVLGKVVKIRCKKCSATIVINGNEQPASGDSADTHVFDYASQSNEQWTVNVADGDQRTLTAAEIANEYRAGVINDETYCWKDGMADWLPLREIEQLYGAVKLGAASAPPRAGEEVSVPLASVPPPAASPLFAAETSPAESPFAATAHKNGNGNGSAALFGGAAGAAVEQPAPAAARRAGGRAQGADLFGNVEKAGGEDDVMTSAATGGLSGATTAGADEKLTGQRNENSVLFSLSALTDNTPKEPSRTTATGDGSGLIDIRALSANMDAGEKKKDSGARVDDIMNLSGGGAFGAALAAPILAPPPLEAVDLGVAATSSGAPKQNKTLVFAILGGCAFIAIAIVVAVVMTRGSTTGEAPKADGTGTASAAAPTETATAATADTNTAPTTATAADDTPPPPGTGQAAGKTGPVNAGTGSKSHGGGKADSPTAAADPPAKPAETKPQDFSGALAAAAGKKPDAPSHGGGGTSSAPFDRGAAAAALGAVNVQSCKKSDGPTGSGHVTVTFAPDGSVQSAVLDGGPFPGTAVGGCIAGKYRGARVPAFGGAPVRVGKSFTVN
ncbi:MAG TPA: zinc-ribbon domain-containing protein [Labilithrix sp.]|nr:zinc-ribbon domain-containing protein [Labilithrix sp.]